MPSNGRNNLDSEKTALRFIQRFTARIWQGVREELENVIDECSKHIINSVSRSLNPSKSRIELNIY